MAEVRAWRTSITDVRSDIFRMLKEWFTEVYPNYKLCAFDEITQEQVTYLRSMAAADTFAHTVQPGFYMKIRPMTEQERSTSAWCWLVGETEEDPQFHLEMRSPEFGRELFTERKVITDADYR